MLLFQAFARESSCVRSQLNGSTLHRLYLSNRSHRAELRCTVTLQTPTAVTNVSHEEEISPSSGRLKQVFLPIKEKEHFLDRPITRFPALARVSSAARRRGVRGKPGLALKSSVGTGCQKASGPLSYPKMTETASPPRLAAPLARREALAALATVSGHGGVGEL